MDYLALGTRIRGLRERRGLSLEALAQTADVPLEELRRIEADQEQPIIATLIKLSKALGVNVADIFRDRPLRQKFEIIRSGKQETVKPLLSPNKNRIFDYQYRLLTIPSDEKHLDAYLIEVAPHQTKPPRTDLTHPGEEFIYLLEGILHGEIAGEAFELSPGDSLYLRSSEPHVFFNPGSTTARALTVIYPFG